MIFCQQKQGYLTGGDTTMIDLYQLTPMEALSVAIEEVAEEEGISKKLAKAEFTRREAKRQLAA